MSEQEKDIMTAPQEKGAYSASSIQVLEGLEAVGLEIIDEATSEDWLFMRTRKG